MRLKYPRPYKKIGKVINKSFGNEKENLSDGAMRLFVAVGKNKGMNNKKLVEFISQWSGVSGHNISNVFVMQDFSFIDVNKADGNKIIKSFFGKWDGGRPLVSKARKR